MSTNFIQINKDFNTASCPFELFDKWFKEAQATEVSDPNAFALATVDENEFPNVRIVLLKDYGDSYFTFYTNFTSSKGKEIIQSRKAAMCFHWKSLERQIRIRGIVEEVSPDTADKYFASRPYLSKIGARVSDQSSPLSSREYFEQKLIDEQKLYPEGEEVPRPIYWSGFCIKPFSIEFWQADPARLHDRIIFTKDSLENNEWNKQRLYP